MIIFNSDLDNTIIFSRRHDIGTEKINVEIYRGREQAYVTKRTHELLKIVKEKTLFVPTTTRTVEQYRRIDLGIGVPEYALVCNGGVLLVNGEEDTNWYQNSLYLTCEAEEELHMALQFLEKEKRRIFELRFIRKLFVFTKCENPGAVVKNLKKRLDTALVDVFNSGTKVYVMPKMLSKGMAVKRFREYVGGTKVIAAGDSEFDISMLNAADVALAPEKLAGDKTLSGDIVFMPGEKVLSEEILEFVLNTCEGKSRYKANGIDAFEAIFNLSRF